MSSRTIKRLDPSMEKLFLFKFNPAMAWLSAGIASVGAFLAPISGFIWLMVGLVSADFCTGLLAAYKSGEDIESSKMRRTIIKFSAYFIGILSAEGVRVVLIENAPLELFQSFQLTYAVIAYIGLTEFKSTLENIKKATGTDLWSNIKNLIDRSPKSPKDGK